ncbi:MAG: hypothetical protein IJ906_01700 [Oscillospiraceae bacterium]|nr:hypothetical protein [Oscillospiraceae bacterium]
MKANQKIALLTALLVSAAAFASCGKPPAPASTFVMPELTGAIEGDGVIEGSFGTIAGQSVPEAVIPEKPEGGNPLTSDDGFKDLSHKIHEANGEDAIFQNHTSLSLRMDARYQHVNAMSDYVYLTPGCSYGHASYYEQYSKDRECFQWIGTDTSTPYLAYVADLTQNYRGHVYWYVPEEESDFYDPEHETITDVFEKDGMIWEYSVMDETGSKDYMAVLMGGEYNGEILHCVEIVNAETYEIIEGRVYAEKDGKTYLLGIDRMEYDLPEPAYISDFLKMFEIGDSKTATVTYVANPGKDNEISKSITVPQYSAVSCFSWDIPDPALYLDAECTQPVEKEWDGKSDITYYVIPQE